MLWHLLTPFIVPGLFALVGLSLCAVSIPLIRGKVPRNYVYGFRTPKTLKSDAIWYPANRVAGICLYQAGRVTVFGSLLLIPFALFLPAYLIALIGLVFLALPVSVALIKSFAYLRRL